VSAWQTVEWCEGRVRLIDQTLLPREFRQIDCETVAAVAEAIRSLRVRGAPAIGVTAALGMALCAWRSQAQTAEELLRELQEAKSTLAATRPTAVNLFWALDRMMRKAEQFSTATPEVLKKLLLEEAEQIRDEDIAANRLIGQLGAQLLPQRVSILTHCNAGALATAGYGTALGIVRAAVESGREVHVYADETRPVLQGARLTAWELMQEGIPVTLITDNMAAHLMKCGLIDCVIVGADRIAANGDVANKIGTYGVAVLAHHHGIPFYVAAPTSTIDYSLPGGEAIPIEERDPEEVRRVFAAVIAPEGVPVRNPAFDVTPHSLISAIITEKGIARPPFAEGLRSFRT